MGAANAQAITLILWYQNLELDILTATGFNLGFQFRERKLSTLWKNFFI